MTLPVVIFTSAVCVFNLCNTSQANFVCHIWSVKIYFTFDRTAEFCQAAHMSRPIKKFVAVFIAIWLPLFSGNVLAVSVAMKTMCGDCQPVVAQQNEHHMHHVSTEQNLQSAAGQDQSSSLHDQQESGCENSGICHLACSGYLATASIKVAEAQPLALSFAPSSTQFQSVALTLLDPPPLARA